MPVSFALQLALRIRRARVPIIDERDIMPNKNAFLNCNTFTNECVTGDFAARSDTCAFLDLDERADLRFITNLTSIQVDESANANVASKLYVGRYQLMQRFISIHSTIFRRSESDGEARRFASTF